MKYRKVVTRIDDILNMFKDYMDINDLPRNTVAIKLMYNPKENGKLAILAESEDWAPGLPPLMVKFDLRRVYGV
jgi:hypothetical protein